VRSCTTAGYDQSFTFSYNPAGQIVSRSGSNDSYAWTGHYNLSRGYPANGLNQYTASGSASPTYDGNGDLTSDGTTSFAYDAENHLVGASGAHSATLAYDPLGRLWQLASGSATTQFVDDGGVILDELTTGGTYVRRFAHGAGSDEPVGWYEGANAARAPLTDERGTAIAFADSSGNGVAIDTYDEYGIPRSSNEGRPARRPRSRDTESAVGGDQRSIHGAMRPRTWRWPLSWWLIAPAMWRRSRTSMLQPRYS